MNELDDPHPLSLVSLILMLALNITFKNGSIESFKTHFACHARSAMSEIMHELSTNSKLYYRLSDFSFWKLHFILKDEIDKNLN